MRRLENHLEKALLVAEKLQKGNARVLDEKLKGDISSFGTAILHNGLLPGIALFSDSSSESGRRRVQLLNAIYHVVEPEVKLPPGALPEKETQLLKLALDTSAEARMHLRSRIMEATIALKLAIRTFELK